MEIEKIIVNKRPSLVNEAYNRIRDAIFSNAMPPGFQETEGELAARLGMSRTPVREAVVRLETEGLVEFRPRRGMRVLPLAPEDVRDIYDLLICLEGQAVERLIENEPTDTQVAKLEGAIADMDKALSQDDLERWASADERFHRLLFEFCGNQRLVKTAEIFWGQGHRARMIFLRLRPKPVKSSAEHRAIVAAICRRDIEVARRSVQEHRRNAMLVMIGVLRDLHLTQL